LFDFAFDHGEIFARVHSFDRRGCYGTFIGKLGRRNCRQNSFHQISSTMVRPLQEDEARLGQADEELEQG
jgi:hypothetical protein